MANEAHKEPTMEEILASIRKIISDDTPGAGSASQAALRDAGTGKSGPQPQKFDFDNDEADLGMFETDDTEFTNDIADDVTEEITGPELSFEAMLGAPKKAETAPEPEPDYLDEIEDNFEPEPAPARPAAAPPAPKPAVPAAVEPSMPASPRYSAPLTDDNTADAAAGALGKLISKMDLGSDNTLEGLVRELLKPMVKEWLDANLARIVEEKVEAEVQRIARMAR